jgi:hypothetical protein
MDPACWYIHTGSVLSFNRASLLHPHNEIRQPLWSAGPIHGDLNDIVKRS